jgi:putative FmdB family regulatory protein
MPLYVFRCPECEQTVDVLKPRNYTEGETCKICGVKMQQLLGTGMKYKQRLGHFFEPYVTDDFTGEPTLIKSMEHLHQIARENNLVLKPGREKLR